jgi:hypothetical protein
MAYDSGRGRALAFSGLGETYEFDGRSWSVLTPATNPASRCGHALAYDTARKRTVFFGGHNEYPPYQNYKDTWEWDGTNWLRLNPATEPSRRWGYGMVYDSRRGRSVLFGGFDTTSLGDTWEWDGTTWQQRSSTTAPPARWFHGMAYDSARGVTVLFGGNDGTTVFGDTWEWDGTNWTRRVPAASPPARFAPGMTYDPVRRRTLIFGGDPAQSGQPCRDDTWEWDGSSWTQRLPTTVPAARYRSGFVFDTQRAQVLMFSGNSGTPDFAGLTDTWSFDGNDWTQVTPHVVPVRGTVAYDTVRRRTVCYGGYMAATARLSDTWEWDGATWTQLKPATQPPARARSAIAFDTKRGLVVMFGGNTATALPNDTWEWNGTSWRSVSLAQSPPGRTGHAVAYDAARGDVVVQGGVGVAGPMFDTWTWDGTQWTSRSPATRPSSFAGHRMAFDSLRQRLVMFGGFDLSGKPIAETWEWDGTGWTKRTPANVPPARYDHAMAYDAARGRVVVYGGYSAQSEIYDTWEWDGIDWTQRTPPRVPRSLPGASMAYDADREVLVFFGNQTWEYAAMSQARAEPYGKGCPGTAGIPALAPRGGQRPWLGDPFTLELSNVPSALAAIVWLGASRTAWGPVPLPLDLTMVGMPGCSLLASPDVLLPVPPNGRLLLAIPSQRTLLGGAFFNQAFVLDPPVNALGLTASNGVAATIGER